MKRTRGTRGPGSAATALVLAVTASGCSSQSENVGFQADAGSSYGVLATHAFVVHSTPVTVTSTSLTFVTDAEVKGYQVGDTLAPADAATAMSTPYLGTITAIAVDTPAAGQTTFTVTPATLDDLFSAADVDQNVAVTTGDPDAVAPLDAGSSTLLTHPLDLSLTTLPSGGAVFSVPGGAVSLSGNGTLDASESSFSISGGVGFTYVKQAGLTVVPEHVRLVFSGGMKLTVGAKLTTTGAVSYRTPLVQYGSNVPLGSFVVFAGPVPIPVSVSLSFFSTEQVSLNGAATLHESVTGAFQLTAGVDYTASGGATGVFEHEGLVNYAPFTASGNLTSATIRMVPLVASLSFNLYGVAGPYVSLSPSLGLQLAGGDGGATPLGTYGLSASLGGSLTIFGHTLQNVSVTLLSLSDTFPLCAPDSLVCSGGPIVAGQ